MKSPDVAQDRRVIDEFAAQWLYERQRASYVEDEQSAVIAHLRQRERELKGRLRLANRPHLDLVQRIEQQRGEIEALQLECDSLRTELRAVRAFSVGAAA